MVIRDCYVLGFPMVGVRLAGSVSVNEMALVIVAIAVGCRCVVVWQPRLVGAVWAVAIPG